MEKVKLKDICRLINGRAYKQEELLDSGKYPVLRVGNFFSDKVFYYSDLELEEDKYCDNGDLLFAWSASFGPKIWDGEKVIYHYHIWKMELTDRVNKEFLFYYLFHLTFYVHTNIIKKIFLLFLQRNKFFMYYLIGNIFFLSSVSCT